MVVVTAEKCHHHTTWGKCFEEYRAGNSGHWVGAKGGNTYCQRTDYSLLCTLPHPRVHTYIHVNAIWILYTNRPQLSVITINRGKQSKVHRLCQDGGVQWPTTGQAWCTICVRVSYLTIISELALQSVRHFNKVYVFVYVALLLHPGSCTIRC